MIYKKVCKNCGKIFSALRPHAKYCSSSCRMQAWRITHPYITPEELKEMKDRLGIKND